MDSFEQDKWGAVVIDHGSSAISPFSLLHGESLVACTAWALGAAEITLVDDSVPWAQLVAAAGSEESAAPFVAHDPGCPMTPPEFLAACAEQAEESQRIVIGVRPVTDTIKGVEGGRLGATIDRERLWSLAAPVVVPSGLLGKFANYPGPNLHDFVASLLKRSDLPVTFREAPTEARRVHDLDDLALLAALTAPAGGARRG